MGSGAMIEFWATEPVGAMPHFLVWLRSPPVWIAAPKWEPCFSSPSTAWIERKLRSERRVNNNREEVGKMVLGKIAPHGSLAFEKFF